MAALGLLWRLNFARARPDVAWHQDLQEFACARQLALSNAFWIAPRFPCMLQAAGTKGKRYAMPNSRIMMHQPIGEPSQAANSQKFQLQ